MAERTAIANQSRGLLSEFGIVIPQGIKTLRAQLPDILMDVENELSPEMRELIMMLSEFNDYRKRGFT